MRLINVIAKFGREMFLGKKKNIVGYVSSFFESLIGQPLLLFLQ